MTNITFSVSKEIYERMKAHPEIKWSEILRRAIKNYLLKIEKPMKITVNEFRGKLDPKLLESIDALDVQAEIEFYNKMKKSESERIKQIDALMRSVNE
ncbi:MAG: hypothetical protein ACTSVY_04680 [Candidatus Helarchaeota archaeon]